MDKPSHSFNLNVQKMCSKLERSQIASFNVAPALWHHDFSSPRPQFTWIILNLCQPHSRFNNKEHTTIEHLPLHFVLQIRWSSSSSSFICKIVQIVSICFRRTFLIRACFKNKFRLTPILSWQNKNNSVFDVSFVCLYIHDHAKQRRFGICSRGLKSETLPLTSVPAGFCFSWKALEALHAQPVWKARSLHKVVAAWVVSVFASMVGLQVCWLGFQPDHWAQFQLKLFSIEIYMSGLDLNSNSWFAWQCRRVPQNLWLLTSSLVTYQTWG